MAPLKMSTSFGFDWYARCFLHIVKAGATYIHIYIYRTPLPKTNPFIKFIGIYDALRMCLGIKI